MGESVWLFTIQYEKHTLASLPCVFYVFRIVIFESHRERGESAHCCFQ